MTTKIIKTLIVLDSKSKLPRIRHEFYEKIGEKVLLYDCMEIMPPESFFEKCAVMWNNRSEG